MHNYAADNARKKLLAGFKEKAADGRGYARPGDKDLWLCATGVQIRGIAPLDDGSAAITFGFEQASGWWCRDGEREQLPTGLPGLGFRFIWTPQSRGYFAGTVWALWSWMNEGTPVEMCAALGKWTTVIAPSLPFRKGAMRSASLPTLAPPDAHEPDPGVLPGPRPEERPDKETLHRWLEENEAVIVAMWVFNDDGKTAYVRQWVVPKHRSDDFAGMMTHRFGDSMELMTDTEAAAAHADEVVLTMGSPGPFGVCPGED